MHNCVARTIADAESASGRSAYCAMGYQCSPSVANFLFFDAREDASALADKLLSHGVIVKPWREPGYRQHVRVSIGLPRSNDLFLAALKKESSHV